MLKKIKAYFVENQEAIVAGLAAINGVFYIPTRKN